MQQRVFVWVAVTPMESAGLQHPGFGALVVLFLRQTFIE
jgi:hypothetical protein